MNQVETEYHEFLKSINLDENRLIAPQRKQLRLMFFAGYKSCIDKLESLVGPGPEDMTDAEFDAAADIQQEIEEELDRFFDPTTLTAYLLA